MASPRNFARACVYFARPTIAIAKIRDYSQSIIGLLIFTFVYPFLFIASYNSSIFSAILTISLLFYNDLARGCRALTWYPVRNILAQLCNAPDDSQLQGAFVWMHPFAYTRPEEACKSLLHFLSFCFNFYKS